MKFPLGHVVATPGALAALANSNYTPDFFINKHAKGEWGEVSEGDKQLNELALVDGSRIMSAYITTLGQRIWIITEADRSSTTILLPEEY